MKRMNSKSRYQFNSMLHELLYFFIIFFMLFPSHVKRIIFCIVYSKNHHPSCIYPNLEEEILQPYIVDVDSISSSHLVPKDESCIPIPLEYDHPYDFVEIEIDSKPVQRSASLSLLLNLLRPQHLFALLLNLVINLLALMISPLPLKLKSE
jgi:hypothetical protein